MFNKKYFFILLLAVVAIGTIASASASDINETTSDIAAADDSVDVTDEISVANDDNSNDGLSNNIPSDERVNDDNGNGAPVALGVAKENVKSAAKVNSTMIVSQSGSYLTNKVIKVRISELNGTLANKNIKLTFFSKNKNKNVATIKIKTNAKGIATYKWNPKKLPVGTYKVTASSLNTKATDDVLDYVKVTKQPLKLKPKKIKAAYSSGKLFKVRLVDSNGKAVKGVKLKLKIYNGRKVAKTVRVTTNAKGYASYKTTKLSVGNHKVIISNTNSKFSVKSVKSAIKINKKTLKVAADSTSGKYWGQIAMGAIDKQAKKLVNKLKLIVKIYTGKKYKKFTLITGYDRILYKTKGIAILETNKFSIGKHKVIISVSNKNFKGSGKTTLKIPKGAKNVVKYTFVLSNGKGRYV